MSSARCRALLDWYGNGCRRLPWRQTTEPYRIWVAEIMLQQTRVATVLGRYADWFVRFPSIPSLAAAPMDAVLKAWEGLGYYRRARFIRQAAGIIVAEHGGAFPADFDAIMALPGIGRSTAGAIGSICFGLQRPVLDGNVKRVLKRWTGRDELSGRQLWQLAQQALEEADDPACWNQAMMELGATLCTPGSAGCDRCPLSGECAAAFRMPAPAAAKAGPVRDLHWQVQMFTCPDRGLWLQRRPDSGIWGGLWSPPIVEIEAAPACRAVHINHLTHRRLHLYAIKGRGQPAGDGCWAGSLADYALPTGIRQLLEKVAAE